MLSTTLPVRWAEAPQELLPIIPPMVQLRWVEGCGPYRSPVEASCWFRSSSTIPGSTTQVWFSSSTLSRRLQYFVQSSTTAVFVHWPARLVPPPRESTGTWCSRHTAIASAPAATVRGITTAIGTCRKFEASVEYAARLPSSKRTSPSTRSRRSRSRCSSVVVAATPSVSTTAHLHRARHRWPCDRDVRGAGSPLVNHCVLPRR